MRSERRRQRAVRDSSRQPTDGVCHERCHNDANERAEHKCDARICVLVNPLQAPDGAGGTLRAALPPALRSSYSPKRTVRV